MYTSNNQKIHMHWMLSCILKATQGWGQVGGSGLNRPPSFFAFCFFHMSMFFASRACFPSLPRAECQCTIFSSPVSLNGKTIL
ncbi:hypothetical protein MBAV_001312 [Candidatus Magnetobacterium bavaricum]|uniref:Uncharacterized protein n=1 Tax=Candidatus Magnetobacterium bavaricum TaxID=29290 RepID=A0A0F3GX61_9BACT|nr:hypothetical protein MBAV_001312 [Candidatus Magnetobacterium bavaricum]